jgi:hypothetical protein
MGSDYEITAPRRFIPKPFEGRASVSGGKEDVGVRKNDRGTLRMSINFLDFKSV